MTGERPGRVPPGTEPDALANALAAFAGRPQNTRPNLSRAEAVDIAILHHLAAEWLSANGYGNADRNCDPAAGNHFPPMRDRPGMRTE